MEQSWKAKFFIEKGGVALTKLVTTGNKEYFKRIKEQSRRFSDRMKNGFMKTIYDKDRILKAIYRDIEISLRMVEHYNGEIRILYKQGKPWKMECKFYSPQVADNTKHSYDELKEWIEDYGFIAYKKNGKYGNVIMGQKEFNYKPHNWTERFMEKHGRDF